jgi:WD40 repeat protein
MAALIRSKGASAVALSQGAGSGHVSNLNATPGPGNGKRSRANARTASVPGSVIAQAHRDRAGSADTEAAPYINAQVLVAEHGMLAVAQSNNAIALWTSPGLSAYAAAHAPLDDKERLMLNATNGEGGDAADPNSSQSGADGSNNGGGSGSGAPKDGSRRPGRNRARLSTQVFNFSLVTTLPTGAHPVTQLAWGGGVLFAAGPIASTTGHKEPSVITVWNVTECTCLVRFWAHEDTITDMIVIPAHDVLVTASLDRSVWVHQLRDWKAETQDNARRQHLRHTTGSPVRKHGSTVLPSADKAGSNARYSTNPGTGKSATFTGTLGVDSGAVPGALNALGERLVADMDGDEPRGGDADDDHDNATGSALVNSSDGGFGPGGDGSATGANTGLDDIDRASDRDSDEGIGSNLGYGQAGAYRNKPLLKSLPTKAAAGKPVATAVNVTASPDTSRSGFAVNGRMDSTSTLPVRSSEKSQYGQRRKPHYQSAASQQAQSGAGGNPLTDPFAFIDITDSATAGYRTLARMTGHTQGVKQLLFVSSADLLLSVGYDVEALGYDLTSNKVVLRFRGHRVPLVGIQEVLAPPSQIVRSDGNQDDGDGGSGPSTGLGMNIDAPLHVQLREAEKRSKLESRVRRRSLSDRSRALTLDLAMIAKLWDLSPSFTGLAACLMTLDLNILHSNPNSVSVNPGSVQIEDSGRPDTDGAAPSKSSARGTKAPGSTSAGHSGLLSGFTSTTKAVGPSLKQLAASGAAAAAAAAAAAEFVSAGRSCPRSFAVALSTGHVIIGGVRLSHFYPVKVSAEADSLAHLTSAMYNPVTRTIYALTDRTIRVFSHTGKRVQTWYNLCPSTITSMITDDRRRKLLLGTQSGAIFVHNAGNGALVRKTFCALLHSHPLNVLCT